MNRPEVPTNLACVWCKNGPAEPVGEPYWSDNKGEGGNGVGRWYQVYTHKGCNSGSPNHFTQWTYAIAYAPVPATAQGEGGE